MASGRGECGVATSARLQFPNFQHVQALRCRHSTPITVSPVHFPLASRREMNGQLDTEAMRDDRDVHQRSMSTESSEPLLTGWPLSPQTPTTPFTKYSSYFPSSRLRRLLIVAFAALSATSLVIFASVSILSVNPHSVQQVPEVDAQTALKEPETSLTDENAPSTHSPYVLGPPTMRFRDNLRNDTQYITSWISAGWTNDVMTYANLIYLGIITSRVPIIAMFTPSHIGGDAETIPFGDVFDVPRFIRDSGVDMLEWREVKDPGSNEIEDLGCWNIWEAVQYNEHYPRRSAVPGWLGLDVSYTRAPDWVHMIPNYEHDPHSTFWSLARLGFSEEREKNLVEPLPSPQHQAVLAPDEQVLCYDYVYYVCAQQSWEFDFDYSPAWRFVGKHLRWTRGLDAIAASYVRRAFGLPEDAETPSYIAIHVRHGDFRNYCTGMDLADCFAPISVIERRVNEVRDELLARKGIDIPHTRVVMTSDESDQAWWDEVTALGWAKVDHDAWETVRTYGRWYPVLLDAVIQSNGLGFVGTDRSTYSTLSRRRVQDWHDGAARIVKWGYKDADAH
ncbi:predicted protein [Postia placenta Mad-698-R]|nr:predicted protein [Postia placenta Mad-698-R]